MLSSWHGLGKTTEQAERFTHRFHRNTLRVVKNVHHNGPWTAPFRIFCDPCRFRSRFAERLRAQRILSDPFDLPEQRVSGSTSRRVVRGPSTSSWSLPRIISCSHWVREAPRPRPLAAGPPCGHPGSWLHLVRTLGSVAAAGARSRIPKIIYDSRVQKNVCSRNDMVPRTRSNRVWHAWHRGNDGSLNYKWVTSYQ